MLVLKRLLFVIPRKLATRVKIPEIRKLCNNVKVEPKEIKEEQVAKKQSKFSLFYKQYGPSFIIIHLTTVVAWIYLFYVISKQGYDLTQSLVILQKLGLMSEDKVKSLHERIDNYKPEKLKGIITGENIKHFATAYIVYKLITPFRYMLSIAITRAFVLKLRSKGIF